MSEKVGPSQELGGGGVTPAPLENKARAANLTTKTFQFPGTMYPLGVQCTHEVSQDGEAGGVGVRLRVAVDTEEGRGSSEAVPEPEVQGEVEATLCQELG